MLGEAALRDRGHHTVTTGVALWLWHGAWQPYIGVTGRPAMGWVPRCCRRGDARCGDSISALFLAEIGPLPGMVDEHPYEDK